MKQITIHRIAIQFDADQITCGSADDQAQQAVEAINAVLQREPYGLAAQIVAFTDADLTVENIDDSDFE